MPETDRAPSAYSLQPLVSNAHTYPVGSQGLQQVHGPREGHASSTCSISMFLATPAILRLISNNSGPRPLALSHSTPESMLNLYPPDLSMTSSGTPALLISSSTRSVHPAIIDAGVKKGAVHIESYGFVSCALFSSPADYHRPIKIVRSGENDIYRPYNRNAVITCCAGIAVI